MSTDSLFVCCSASAPPADVRQLRPGGRGGRGGPAQGGRRPRAQVRSQRR